MKKSVFLLIFTLLTCISCNNKLRNKELIGVYKSKKLSFAEKIKYRTTKDIEGFTLSLKENNLFEYNTCGILVNGNWTVSNDSLRLNAIKLKFIIDSLNMIKKPEERKDFLIFKIKGNSLIGHINGVSGLRINKLDRVLE